MTIEFCSSISSIDAQQWQALWAEPYPFIQHGFLQALEESGCVGADSGWQMQHCLLWNEEKTQLLGAMPLYIKHHSYGEYVFDWAWADAYHRAGLEYYPKLLAAIPFTPASGPRIGFAPGQDAQQIGDQLIAACLHKARDIDASSFHLLFPHQRDRQILQKPELMPRTAVQFHWHNHGYQNFDEFLATFKSRKRKSLKAERRKVAEQQVSLVRREGKHIDEQQWQRFYHCYQLTYLKRSGHKGYLNWDFFQRLGQSCADQIMMVQAYQRGDMVAGALYFKDSQTLYGRYWGCLDEFEALHFEACYYQGIVYAIEQNLQRFDPGAQGEHKIQRGFTPSLVHSLHWIEDQRFARAIEDFLDRERHHIASYQEDAARYLPFKEGS
ncbi:MAG: GNAT family N-acetyltransferase [Cellvibrionaceae bacterium]|nr:GNAT family N-acetyltransferase [Cellvibrionaceae bacterium]